MTTDPYAPLPVRQHGTPVLEATDLVAGFGVTTVLHGVSLSVRQGEVAGVFGLNGAGKSVTMKVLGGTVGARSGRIVLEGEDVTHLSAEDRVRRGMGHVPQGRQVFGALTVEENLRLGAYTLRRRKDARYASVLSGVLDRFPQLADRRGQLAGTMSGGQQASLAVARALMAEPKVVLVDEPSAGLSPVATQELLAVLRDVRDAGTTMVLVEQNVAFGLRLVDTVTLLQTGTVVHHGPTSELDPGTLAARLGVGRMLGASVGASLQGPHEHEHQLLDGPGQASPARRGPRPLPAGSRTAAPTPGGHRPDPRPSGPRSSGRPAARPRPVVAPGPRPPAPGTQSSADPAPGPRPPARA